MAILKPWWNPSARKMLLTWVVFTLAAYFVHLYTQQGGSDSVKVKPPTVPAVVAGDGKKSAPRADSGTGDSSDPSHRHPRGPSREIPSPADSPRPSSRERMTAKAGWTDFQTHAKPLREILDEAVKNAEVCTALLKALSQNDEGRRIAGSPTHVDRLCNLLEEPPPTADFLKGLRDTVQVHLEMAKTCLDQEGNAIPPEGTLIQDLQRLKTEVEPLALRCRHDRDEIERLRAETASLPPAERTLDGVLEARIQERRREDFDQRAAARKAAREEGQRKIREAEVKAIQEVAQAEADSRVRVGIQEARRIRETTEIEFLKAQANQAKDKRQAEAARLRAMAEDPEVQRQYLAFLAKGYARFTGPPSGALGIGKSPAPVSFGDLSRNGWLKNRETFAHAMYKQPSSNLPRFNDRPTRPYPTTPAEFAETERLLEQFKILGPVWVEMGLLEP
jgi:hypothetical protein